MKGWNLARLGLLDGFDVVPDIFGMDPLAPGLVRAREIVDANDFLEPL